MSKVLVDRELLEAPAQPAEVGGVERWSELKKLAEEFPSDLDWDSNTTDFFNGPSGESLGGDPDGTYAVYGKSFRLEGEDYDYDGPVYVERCNVEFAKFMVSARDGVLDLLAALSAVTAERDRLDADCGRLLEGKIQDAETISVLEAERDQLRAEVDLLMKESEGSAERAKHYAGKLGKALGEVEGLRDVLEEMTADRDGCAHQRDQLRAERDRLRRDLDECDGGRWRLRTERNRLRAEIEALRARIASDEKKQDALLAHCPDGECGECSKIICEHGDPMHFHHDGCPSCWQAAMAAKEA